MDKTVEYQGVTYYITYSYTQARELTAQREHAILVYKIDHLVLAPTKEYIIRWTDTAGHRVTIMSKVLELIRSILKTKERKDTQIDEFENWNGDLDRWDE